MKIVTKNSLTISKVNDGTITHYAYAYSADGTDRFTTVYPNLNLLVNSSAKTKDGFFKNFDKVENDYGEITIKGTDRWAQINLSDGFSIQPRDYKPNDTYTMSMDIMFTSWNFPAGTSIGEFWIGQRYLNPIWKRICAIDLPRDPSQMLNQWIRITNTSTIPSYADLSINTETILMARLAGTSEASFTLRVRKPKQEFGSVATPHMPSASEVTTADYPSYIGQYTDFTSTASTDPAKYAPWTIFKGNDGKTGANGKDGIAGKDGIGIKTTDITYAISISGTTAPTSGWTSSVPSLVKGQYLWTKTVWTYTDSSSKTGYSVTYISKDGNNGTDGIAGKDGVGILTTTITYAGSTSGTTAPTSGWTATVPTVEAGSYLWTKTVWAYTDNTSETGYSVAKMGNDGTITHTAWSWSADGTDRFTTTYPNLNLLDGTSKSAKTRTIFKDNNATVIYGSVNQFSEKTITGSVYLDLTNSPYDVWLQFWTPTAVLYGNTIKAGQKGYSTFSGKVPIITNTTSNIAFRTSTAVTSTITFDYSEAKLEEGSVATPWMPSSSEVKTSDYPNYIGTYLDSNVESSSDYKRYQWTIFKGQDSNAYTAYSWSSDGTDRFSTTYPNLNLLDGTSQPFIMGYGIPNTTWDTTNKVSGISLPLTVITDEVLPQGTGFPYMYAPNVTYTQSIYISTDAPLTGTPISFTWFTNEYEHNMSGVDNLVKISTNVYRATSIYTWPSSKASANGRNVDIKNLTKVFDFTKGTFLQFYKPKLELGSVATPWMPSASEVQEQWQDAIPMYIGVGEKDSQNPSDYRWQLNPRYVQASSDSGLSNKAGVDDLASVANTANDALVQAQNAVSNEDYTSWLEHDYQTTINNLQDVSAQNQEDINNVDDRTTIVEGFYGEMKVKWNFIDESFTFSEEGMFISNAQSKMAIQVTSDKIVFWDNNVDVAFITGEVLNIQKGVFLESATIGNHLITKFSDDSPVTIIRYVGGIT